MTALEAELRAELDERCEAAGTLKRIPVLCLAAGARWSRSRAAAR